MRRSPTLPQRNRQVADRSLRNPVLRKGPLASGIFFAVYDSGSRTIPEARWRRDDFRQARQLQTEGAFERILTASHRRDRLAGFEVREKTWKIERIDHTFSRHATFSGYCHAPLNEIDFRG